MEDNSHGMQELTDKLIAWITRQVVEAGARGVVVGLSGGVDSTVTAALCKKAFPQDVLGLVLPCYSSPTDMDHALLAADKFAIPSKVVVLDEVFDFLRNLFAEREVVEESETPGVSLKDLALANVKPRLRMLSLYFFANQLGYLVAGSGNKSELSVGYFTKYGDGGVDILPLGNLLKTQVNELATYLGTPREICQKPPSAGLWEGQIDEQELGLTYKELDTYLLTGKASLTKKKRIDQLMEATNHKRKLPPVPLF